MEERGDAKIHSLSPQRQMKIVLGERRVAEGRSGGVPKAAKELLGPCPVRGRGVLEAAGELNRQRRSSNRHLQRSILRPTALGEHGGNRVGRAWRRGAGWRNDSGEAIGRGNLRICAGMGRPSKMLCGCYKGRPRGGAPAGAEPDSDEAEGGQIDDRHSICD
jgi:hypothetical protein